MASDPVVLQTTVNPLTPKQFLASPSPSSSPSTSSSSHEPSLLRSACRLLYGGVGGYRSRPHQKADAILKNDLVNLNNNLHYLKPGALAQLRDERIRIRSSSSSCSRKRKRSSSENTNPSSSVEIVRVSDEIQMNSPPLNFLVFGPVCPQRKKLSASKAIFPYSFPTAVLPSSQLITRESSSELSDPAIPDVSHSQQQSSLESLPLHLLVIVSFPSS